MYTDAYTAIQQLAKAKNQTRTSNFQLFCKENSIYEDYNKFFVSLRRKQQEEISKVMFLNDQNNSVSKEREYILEYMRVSKPSNLPKISIARYVKHNKDKLPRFSSYDACPDAYLDHTADQNSMQGPDSEYYVSSPKIKEKYFTDRGSSVQSLLYSGRKETDDTMLSSCYPKVDSDDIIESSVERANTKESSSSFEHMKMNIDKALTSPKAHISNFLGAPRGSVDSESNISTFLKDRLKEVLKNEKPQLNHKSYTLSKLASTRSSKHTISTPVIGSPRDILTKRFDDSIYNLSSPRLSDTQSTLMIGNPQGITKNKLTNQSSRVFVGKKF